MSDTTPLASVIVPTYERPGPLAACLDALGRLDYPRDRLEVIVVNDGGAPPSAEVLDRPGLPVTLVTQANAGPASARNAGAARARGSVLAFTDDDCRPAADWLRLLAGAVAADPDCAAGGRTVNLLRDNRCATASQLLVDYLYEYYDGADGPQFFTSNNLAVDATRFHALGGFDPSFRRAAGEDRDFCDHWRHRGGRLRYIPAALVQHAHHLSLRRFWRQHFAYGTGAWHFHGSRARRETAAPRVEPLSFYLGLLAYPWRRAPGPGALPLVGLMLVSQVANAAGYFVERRRGGGPGGT